MTQNYTNLFSNVSFLAYPRPIHVFTKKKKETAVASWSGAPGAATARPGCAVAAPYVPYVLTSLFIFNEQEFLTMMCCQRLTPSSSWAPKLWRADLSVSIPPVGAPR